MVVPQNFHLPLPHHFIHHIQLLFPLLLHFPSHPLHIFIHIPLPLLMLERLERLCGVILPLILRREPSPFLSSSLSPPLHHHSHPQYPPLIFLHVPLLVQEKGGGLCSREGEEERGGGGGMVLSSVFLHLQPRLLLSLFHLLLPSSSPVSSSTLIFPLPFPLLPILSLPSLRVCN